MAVPVARSPKFAVATIVLAWVASWAQAPSQTPELDEPIEDASYVSERFAANVLESDVPKAVATWRFIRRYGYDIEGLTSADQSLLVELADIDQNQIGDESGSPIVASMCREYETKALDIVGAARMLDRSTCVHNEAFEGAIQSVLSRLSPAGTAALARRQRDFDLDLKPQRTRHWEGVARDVPNFMRMMLTQICRRFAAQTTVAGDETRAPVIREVFRASGTMKIAPDGTRYPVFDDDRGSSEPSGGLEIGFGRRSEQVRGQSDE